MNSPAGPVPKEPRYYQTEAIDSLYAYFESHDGNPLIGLPCGTGKSYVIAAFIRSAMDRWPDQRILCLTHVKTLIRQNYEELVDLWPMAPCGVCSAGLNKFDTALPIIFGGVQSVVNRIDRLGYRDLLVIDEAHLLSPKAETSYQKVIAGLKAINPWLKVIGLSATCWRLGQGRLTDGGLFTDICYDLTDLHGFNRMLAEGWLVPPIAPTRMQDGRQMTQIDLSGVHIQGYGYNEKELDAASNQEKLNLACCREMHELAADRKSWLIFCASIDHAENINAILQGVGIDSEVVHSKRGNEHNEKTIDKWKQGKLRCIVNKDMLTTGVNNPRCDFIGCLRGLVSSCLWVQMLGRITRPYPEGNKENGLVADFAGNTRRLGPINDPVLPRKPGKAVAGSMPVRICDACGVYNHASARICIACGAEFPWNSKLGPEASEARLVKSTTPELVTYDVHHVVYHPHNKQGSPESMRVSYHVGNQGIQKFDEWVCFQHRGFASKKAREWWRSRMAGDPPETTQEALERSLGLMEPRRVTVDLNKKYPEVQGVEF